MPQSIREQSQSGGEGIYGTVYLISTNLLHGVNILNLQVELLNLRLQTTERILEVYFRPLLHIPDPAVTFLWIVVIRASKKMGDESQSFLPS